MMLRQTAKEAVIIVVVAIAIGVAVYAVRPDKIQGRAEVKPPGDAALSAEEEGVFIIPVDEAYLLHQEQRAVFIDARHGADYDAGHIKGAVNLTVAGSEMWLSDFLDATDPSTIIITYCDGENCHLAPELAEFLFFNGFDHIFFLENGWTRWRESGFPAE